MDVVISRVVGVAVLKPSVGLMFCLYNFFLIL